MVQKVIRYRFKKKDVCNYLGINNVNFSHQIGRNIEVIHYCGVRNIGISGHKFHT